MEAVGQQRRFRIHHGLGRGGYGEVYKATMTSPGGLRAEVAVKLLRLDQHSDEDAVRRLRDEGRLLAALRHPTILRVYDLAVLEGRVGLVTEFVDGQDLTGCMAEPDPIGLRPLLEVVGLVAEGLEAAYRAPAPDTGEPMHLVHRDVKPSNLRISRHGEVKILDFGIARSEAVDREARTGSQATLGSLAYMSPERFDARPVGPEGDVFSLGCVLYEGLAGRRFHPEAVPVHMYRMAASLKAWKTHCDEAFACLEHVPEPVVALIRDMLAHDPDDRIDAHRVATRCEALLPGLEGPSLKRWARERSWPASELIQTTYDGRTLTDGTLNTAAMSTPSWLPSVPDASETIEFERLGTDEATAPMTAPVFSPELPSHTTESVVVEERSAVPLLLGGIVVLLAMTVLVWWTRSEAPEVVPPAPEPAVAAEPTPQPRRTPAPAPAPAPEPESEPVVQPEPAPAEPAPAAAPSPTPRPEPTPAPAPQPTPAPAPEPEPEPTRIRPVGTIEVQGASLDYLVARDGRKIVNAHTVPVGGYTVVISFGAGTEPVELGNVRIAEGTTTFDCNRLTYECVRK